MTDGNTFTEIADGECRRDLPAEDLLFARFRVRTRLQPVPYKPFVLVSRPDGSRRFPSCLSSRPEPPLRWRSGGTCIFYPPPCFVIPAAATPSCLSSQAERRDLHFVRFRPESAGSPLHHFK